MNSDLGSDRIPMTSARRHMPALAFAVGSSMVLHLAVILGLPGFELSVLERPDKPREHQPVELSEMRYDSSDMALRPDRFKAEDPSLRADLPSQIKKFKHAIDDSSTMPRAVPHGVSVAAMENVRPDDPTYAKAAWIPRQKILKINEKFDDDTVDARPRRLIPDIERVARAPDVVLPVDSDRGRAIAGAASAGYSSGQPQRVDVAALVRGTRPVLPVPGTVKVPIKPVVPQETPREVTGTRQLDDLLNVAAETFVDGSDPDFGYVKIDITRIGPQLVPRMPKDVVILQDSSTSMTEQKLHFCRNGLLRILEELGPDDRFNVMSFSDSAVKCFDKWTANSKTTVRKAQDFVRDMKASGETDLFASLRGLMDLSNTAGRPLIAFVVTDGRPTTGVTDSTEIIERFSTLNRGGISVFTMGTVTTANSYLLDLLSFRNRGDSYVVRKGRWDIPAAMKRRFSEVSRPVLSRLRYAVSSTTPCEMYPVRLTNLYLDRPLVLYGRFPKGTGRTVFQIVGSGKDNACDMVFSVNLQNARRGDKDIRSEWAWHRIYHLIGEYTRTQDRKLLGEIDRMRSDYRIKVPYDVGQ